MVSVHAPLPAPNFPFTGPTTEQGKSLVVCICCLHPKLRKAGGGQGIWEASPSQDSTELQGFLLKIELTVACAGQRCDNSLHYLPALFCPPLPPPTNFPALAGAERADNMGRKALAFLPAS